MVLPPPVVGVLFDLIAVVIDNKITVAMLDKTLALVIAVLIGGVRKREIFEALATSHEAADNVAAVCGCKCKNSRDLDHG